MGLLNNTGKVEFSWNVIAHGDALEGKWRGNCRMQWVASTLHTNSENGVSSITNADVHTSAASVRVNWSTCRFKWTRPFRRKTKSGFCACAITFQMQTMYLLTYLLTHSMRHSPSWEANRFSGSRIPHIYGTRRFITAFTSARHPSLSWTSSIQSTPPHLIPEDLS